MIPTSYKKKLPTSLAYPIGAQALGTALHDAPNVERLTASYHAQVGWSATDFRRNLIDRNPSKIMAIAYQPARHPGLCAATFMIEAGWYEEKWGLSVYPVIAETRSLAGRLLREEGLPAIATWLGSSVRKDWRSSPHRMELWFNAAEGSIATREFHNEQQSRV